MKPLKQTAEYQRLVNSQERKSDWKHWGPYISERAWGTVREDYSENGTAWDYFPHDHARSRAYRWGEDGLAGVCNRFQNLCLSVALWNERDPILKERLFGLSGTQGNHGEDVKEYYFYLDSTPTHSYMKMLYKYPQVEYPYGLLAGENQRRGRHQPEYELIDAVSQAFQENRYFDVLVEYAKAAEEDILCRITVTNRGPEAAPIHVLPHIWYRNTWSWGYNSKRPELHAENDHTIRVHERHLGERRWSVSADGLSPTLLFTENDSNSERLFNYPNASPYVKDSINDSVVNGKTECVNPKRVGTKAAADFRAVIEPGAEITIRVRFAPGKHDDPFHDFDAVFQQRIADADEYYAALQNPALSADERLVQRQAFAGLLWTKQFYHYGVELWLQGDSAAPPESRKHGRNSDWAHLYTLDVLSMPDKWEYPWFAAWDLAFHCVPIAMIDPDLAKRQLILLTREWYMHPNGQIPAYEWAFGDVNPPVHAWAALRVYRMDRDLTGKADTVFLERIFHKLLLNFTWWVNRKDREGRNVFQGGFLGLDNIGVFDRSAQLPIGGHIDQADGTAWMAMYCLNMLGIALELAYTKPAYEDVATKFFEHFIYIANAIYGKSFSVESDGIGLWDEQDGFFYDILSVGEASIPLRTRSFVGLIPLFAVEVIDAETLDKLPRFRQRMDWFVKYRPQLVADIHSITKPGKDERRLLAIVNRDRLARILQRMLDPDEFLSDYGLRSVSKFHQRSPYTFHVNGEAYTVDYQPAESNSGLFGGNSNWRGPIWFPVNYLMIEALYCYHAYHGESFHVEMPYGSGKQVTLTQVAADLSRRMSRIFLRNEQGQRAVFGNTDYFQRDPLWRDYVPFYEYFHGDNGAGVGASHQTGWTALVAELLQRTGGQNGK